MVSVKNIVRKLGRTDRVDFRCCVFYTFGMPRGNRTEAQSSYPFITTTIERRGIIKLIQS